MASHRILLLNFTQEETAAVGKAGFNVERGLMGAQSPTSRHCALSTPHPLYEYDVLVYNSHLTSKLRSEFETTRNLFVETGSLQALMSFDSRPFVRVAFIGGDGGAPELYLGGIPFAKLIRAEHNVSSFLECKCEGLGTIEKLHKLITGFKGQIASPQNSSSQYQIKITRSTTREFCLARTISRWPASEQRPTTGRSHGM